MFKCSPIKHMQYASGKLTWWSQYVRWMCFVLNPTRYNSRCWNVFASGSCVHSRGAPTKRWGRVYRTLKNVSRRLCSRGAVRGVGCWWTGLSDVLERGSGDFLFYCWPLDFREATTLMGIVGWYVSKAQNPNVQLRFESSGIDVKKQHKKKRRILVSVFRGCCCFLLATLRRCDYATFYVSECSSECEWDGWKHF